MTSPGDRLGRALAAIDRANAEDPRTVMSDTGPLPLEVAHSDAMTAWIRRLVVEPGEAQLIAARAHHLRRWTRPRGDYPEGRAGYLRWRLDARRRHAEEVSDLLGPLGYSAAELDRIGALIAKTAPADDPEMQAHEDALCLVFLERQAVATAADLGEERAVEVLRKTLAKMSPSGRHEARLADLGDLSTLVGEIVGALDQP